MQPPVRPSNSTIDHVPCDIVIVIDVSCTMDRDVSGPPPADGIDQGERFPRAAHSGESCLNIFSSRFDLEQSY